MQISNAQAVLVAGTWYEATEIDTTTGGIVLTNSRRDPNRRIFFKNSAIEGYRYSILPSVPAPVQNCPWS